MTALEQLCQHVLEGKSWDYLKLPDRNIAQQLLNNGVMALNKDGILITPLSHGPESAWTTHKPDISGTYWMRTVGNPKTTQLCFIADNGEIWPCDCQSTKPYDRKELNPVEWAEVKSPE